MLRWWRLLPCPSSSGRFRTFYSTIVIVLKEYTSSSGVQGDERETQDRDSRHCQPPAFVLNNLPM